MSFLIRNFIFFILFFSLSYLAPAQVKADMQKYDLVYAWDKDLESILDYREQLEEFFEPNISNRLKVVKKGDEYGVIYDCNAKTLSILKVIVKQGILLQEAGLEKAFAIEDTGYHELFNVSYGYGPNLDAMIKTYQTIYTYLGRSVGKDLYIEQDDKGKYMLVYRRHGGRSSALTVAKRHGRLLRKKGIRTTIAEELNNPVVYGESTYLHGEEEVAADRKTPIVSKMETKELSRTQPKKISRPTKEGKHQLNLAIAVLRPGKKKVAVQSASSPSLPYTTKVRPSLSLRTKEAEKDTFASYIEKKVEIYIKELRRKGKLRGDEKTGWVIYDLKRDVSLVDINADKPFQAASMIKPFVALAFFHKVSEGGLSYGPKSRRKMEAMIQRSSNPATNWVMRQVGGPASCQKILTTHYSQLFKHLRIVEYIPKGGRTYRNMALPSDYVRFLRALWNKELPYSNEVRRLMSLPGRDRLYYGTPIPQGTLVYNKTGTTAHLCGDMGILAPKTQSRNRYPYAIVGIIESSSRPSNYRQWMKSRGSVIRQVSTLVYKDLKKRYALR